MMQRMADSASTASTQLSWSAAARDAAATFHPINRRSAT